MKLKITRKESYSIYIDTNYININSIKDGEWYIAIFSDMLYLHKDGVIRDGVKDRYRHLGYFSSYEEADNFYQSYILKNNLELCIDTE